MLQALRFGRFGMSHVIMMGSSGAFIALSIQACERTRKETRFRATAYYNAGLLHFFSCADRGSGDRRGSRGSGFSEGGAPLYAKV